MSAEENRTPTLAEVVDTTTKRRNTFENIASLALGAGGLSVAGSVWCGFWAENTIRTAGYESAGLPIAVTGVLAGVAAVELFVAIQCGREATALNSALAAHELQQAALPSTPPSSAH